MQPEAPSPVPAQDETLQQRLTAVEIEAAALRAELTRTQMQLIAAEKMAALGLLLVNVGHEINTPVGAMMSSAQAVAARLEPLVRDLPALLATLPPDVHALFHRLLQAAVLNDTSLTTREERQHRQALQARFTQAGVPDAEALAHALVEMQLVAVDEYLPLFRHAQAGNMLAVLKLLAQVRLSVLNLNLAANKVVKLVQALKAYARSGSDDEQVPVVLEQNIQGILTIYHNLLKHGVQLVTDYQPVPPVLGVPDQLGQVWANLIHNAIHAMGGSGELSIGLSAADGYVRVRITDTGYGIPPEHINRIFDPFFTTKTESEGTGIGLDVCRRIVERHGGRITVASRPGHTEFTVELPAAPAGTPSH